MYGSTRLMSFPPCWPASDPQLPVTEPSFVSAHSRIRFAFAVERAGGLEGRGAIEVVLDEDDPRRVRAIRAHRASEPIKRAYNLIERGLRWTVGQDPALAGAYFEKPEMTKPRKDVKPFEYVEAKIPFYPPSKKWGVQADPITKMQKPLSVDESVKHYVTPVDFEVRVFVTEEKLGGKPIAMAWDERGLPRFVACGYLEERGGVLHPGRYVRALREEAVEVLRPLERNGNLQGLAGFLSYRQFDPTPFPALMAVLAREKVDRPPPEALPFACKPASAAPGTSTTR